MDLGLKMARGGRGGKEYRKWMGLPPSHHSHGDKVAGGANGVTSVPPGGSAAPGLTPSTWGGLARVMLGSLAAPFQIHFFFLKF